MNIDAKAQQKIDAYLSRLRSDLQGLPSTERDEIIEELRGHILDKASAEGNPGLDSVDAALTRLGNTEDLAAAYRSDYALAQVEVSRSPWRVLSALFRWATLSVFGFAVLVVCTVGYFLGAAFFLCAILKPFHPHAAGLWKIPGPADSWDFSLRMGFSGVPPGGHELLGWWMVPAGLILGSILLWFTTRFVLWCARKARPAHAAGLIPPRLHTQG